MSLTREIDRVHLSLQEAQRELKSRFAINHGFLSQYLIGRSGLMAKQWSKGINTEREMNDCAQVTLYAIMAFA
jgi:hypothetical protein